MRLRNVVILGFSLVVSSCIQDSPQDQNENLEIEETEYIPDSLVTDSFVKYVIQPESSELNWIGERVGGEGHKGKVNIKSGYLRCTQNRISGGEIIIDMTSLREFPVESEETTQILIGYLHSSRFFDTEKYPIAILKIREENRGKLYADLQIRNSSKPVVIPFRKEIEDHILKASGEFGIDRTLWGIDYLSESGKLNPGELIIKDSIYFSTRIVAFKEG